MSVKNKGSQNAQRLPPLFPITGRAIQQLKYCKDPLMNRGHSAYGSAVKPHFSPQRAHSTSGCVDGATRRRWPSVSRCPLHHLSVASSCVQRSIACPEWHCGRSA
jgi:hypothetical protein